MSTRHSAPRILIVEDEAKIRSVLRAYFSREGFEVEEAATGDRGLAFALEEEFDLVVLDLMLPGMPGEKVAAELARTKKTPVLMLTAKGEEWERVRGFELGADDYVVKPFSPREVVARARAILRRVGRGLPDDLPVVSAPGLRVDPAARLCLVDGADAALTATEFDLLYELAAHPGRVYRRAQLASLVLGYDHESYERTIDSHVKNLRKKLAGRAVLVETVFGVGYRFASTALSTGASTMLGNPDNAPVDGGEPAGGKG